MNRKTLFLLLTAFSVLLAAGCAGGTPDVSPEPFSEPEQASSEESSVLSEIILSEDPSESSEESEDPGFVPYRDGNEFRLEELELEGIPVKSFSLSASSLSAEVGERVRILWTCSPLGANVGEIRWSSSDERVASVENGIVTGVSEGSATIRAETGGGKTGSCTVTVTAVRPKSALEERIRSVVGTDDYRYWSFALYDFDGDGKEELIAQTVYTETGVPRASVYRVESGEELFSLAVGAVGESWTVRKGSYSEHFVLIESTMFPEMSGNLVCQDALEYRDGEWSLTRLSERETLVNGSFSYTALVDGILVSCDRATYRTYRSDDGLSRFQRDNPASLTILFCTGANAAEAERNLLHPEPPAPSSAE